MATQDDDFQLAERCDRLAQLLATRKCRMVLAESCTGGLVTAWLAGVPGISEYLCGSLVTYREATKTQWLGIRPQWLVEHTAVSAQVTRAMALAALTQTPEADVAAAVTGHLGPVAPRNQDGLIYLAAAIRSSAQTGDELASERQVRLEHAGRRMRQQEAVQHTLDSLISVLERRDQSDTASEP